MPIIYWKNLFAYFLPIILFLIYLFIFFIGVALKKIRAKDYLIYTALFFILLLF